jgi:uncharacterized Zn finger protein (UPF0148 family)
MILCLCPACHSPIVFANEYRGYCSPCPNCRQPFAVPTESLSEEAKREVIERLHRWARDTDQICRETDRAPAPLAPCSCLPK